MGESLDINSVNTVIDEGGVSVMTPLTLGAGDASMSLTDTFQLDNPVVVAPARWSWRLRANTATESFDENDLEVEYQIGANNQLESTIGSSTVDIDVITRFVEVNRQNQENTAFRGYIDINLDYGNSTLAGSYTGILTVTVRCR